jgi:hypothetical protein
VHWILQENLFKESEWETMIQVLERWGIPYSVHKVIPFIGELVPAPEPRQEKVICFGSYSMRHSAVKFGWDPGVYDLEPFNFVEQMKHWGQHMLNADSEVVPFKDVKFTDMAFLRPIEDSKVFAGKVFDQDEFEDWQKKVCVLEEDYGTLLTKDTLVQVCKPKVIYAEYRYWIVAGKIVTKSLYKRGDRVIYSSDVDRRFDHFVSSVTGNPSFTLGAWQPHRAFVIDVCDTPEGIKIVEINTMNSAGFYAGDVQSIIMALEEMEG